MTIVETTAGSGALLGAVVVLILQQLGLLALADPLWTIVTFLVAIVFGAIVFGAVGAAVERNR